MPQDAQDESSFLTEPPYTFLTLQDSSGLPLSRVDQCERDMHTAMEKKLVHCLKDGLTSGHIALDMRNKTNLEINKTILEKNKTILENQESAKHHDFGPKTGIRATWI